MQGGIGSVSGGLNSMRTPVDARSHVYRANRPGPVCEERILAEFCRPGLRALDVGCGAVGRSARKLQRFGASVYSFDINEQSVREFAHSPAAGGIRLFVGDLLHLPFGNGYFDLVLIAVRGLDYFVSRAERTAAILEVDRVLAAGGLFAFNSANPIGNLLSPRGLHRRAYWRWRRDFLLSRAWRRDSFIDLNGLRLRQTPPHRVIPEVTENTGMSLVCMMNRQATSRNLALLTLFSSAPYYLFRKAS